MRKFLLAACIFSCSDGFGQNQDIFDIEKYLQKKNSEEKKILINPYFRIWTPGEIEKSIDIRTLPGTNRVITLPQDNMPCLIMDINVFNMPNLFDPGSEIAKLLKAVDYPGKMPNVSQPSILTPVR